MGNVIAHNSRTDRHRVFILGGILEINFVYHCAKSHRFDVWQTEGSHQKQNRHWSTNIEPTYCLEVMLSSHYCTVFECCNTTEYYNWRWAAICIIFSSNYFIDHTYRMNKSLPVYEVYNFTSFRFQSCSRWCMSPYRYFTRSDMF